MIRLAALRATPRRTTRAAAVTAAPAIRRPAVPLAYPRASRRDRSATARQHCVTHWQTGFGKPSRANPARQHRGRVVDEALCASKSRIVGIRRDDVQSRRTVGGRGRIDYQVGQLENGRVGAGLGTRGPALLASPALAPLSPASSDARPALPPLARPAAGVSSRRACSSAARRRLAGKAARSEECIRTGAARQLQHQQGNKQGEKCPRGEAERHARASASRRIDVPTIKKPVARSALRS